MPPLISGQRFASLYPSRRGFRRSVTQSGYRNGGRPGERVKKGSDGQGPLRNLETGEDQRLRIAAARSFAEVVLLLSELESLR